jgi:hypothetical protein
MKYPSNLTRMQMVQITHHRQVMHSKGSVRFSGTRILFVLGDMLANGVQRQLVVVLLGVGLRILILWEIFFFFFILQKKWKKIANCL